LYRPRLFFIAEDGYWIEIPKSLKWLSLIKADLDIKIKDCIEFLEGNPLSGSYRKKLAHLTKIKNKHFFENSVNFMQEFSNEYREI